MESSYEKIKNIWKQHAPIRNKMAVVKCRLLGKTMHKIDFCAGHHINANLAKKWGLEYDSISFYCVDCPAVLTNQRTKPCNIHIHPPLEDIGELIRGRVYAKHSYKKKGVPAK